MTSILEFSDIDARYGPMAGPGGPRRIAARWVIQGDLVLESAAHLGNGDEGEGTDLAIVREASQGDGQGPPLLPGTSLAGALRLRARRIARLVYGSDADDKVKSQVEDLFGPRHHRSSPDEEDGAPPATSGGESPHSSRLRVSEARVTEGTRLRPGRIRIDRFTQGVVNGGLFEEEPDYQGTLRVDLELRYPPPREEEAGPEGKEQEWQRQVGLVLLLCKNLVTGDLAVGGTSSVGRGVFKGTATIRLPGENTEITFGPDHPANGDLAARLEAFVSALYSNQSKEGQQ